MSSIRVGGIGVCVRDACGCSRWNFSCWFLERRSAKVLSAPGIQDAVMCVSCTAVKNQRHLSKCMTIPSLDEPFDRDCIDEAAIVTSKFDAPFGDNTAPYSTAQYDGNEFLCHYINWSPFRRTRELKPLTIEVCSISPCTGGICLYLIVM